MIRDLLSGKKLFVPKVDSALPGGMDMFRIEGEEDLRSLPSGVWGIKEPTSQYRETPRMKGP
jgi:5-formyltetrahydrofolate cyclo-ligase